MNSFRRLALSITMSYFPLIYISPWEADSFPVGKKSPPFREHECSLPCPQQPASVRILSLFLSLH